MALASGFIPHPSDYLSSPFWTKMWAKQRTTCEPTQFVQNADVGPHGSLVLWRSGRDLG